MAHWVVAQFRSCKSCEEWGGRPIRLLIRLDSGVITNDLAKIVAANKDDRDDSNGIKWQKYEVMSEAVAPLALFQARGSPVEHVPVSAAARALIIDTPRLNEEVRVAGVRVSIRR